MKNFGYIPSLITDNTRKFKSQKSLKLPVQFSYRNFLSPVGNQGDEPYCIPYSIATWLNWKYNINNGGGTKDNFVRYSDIYNSKTTSGSGMTYIDAFDYLKKYGVMTNRGIMKISDVGVIPNFDLIKPALIANGPVFGSLPVYDHNADMFWKDVKDLEGWHSVTIVGWDERGYIIRNSWGVSFGNGGYITLPYEDVDKFHEMWTILG